MKPSVNEEIYKLKHLARLHVRSYKWAFRGLASIFAQQLNFKLELIISIFVVIAGIFFEISKFEWLMITFVIFMVLTAEALNSAIEAISDVVSKEKHQDIRYAKDVGAGAVLLAAIGSLVVGIIIFLPYIEDKL